MHIRDLAKQRWREAGLYDSKKAKLRAFLKYVDHHPEQCLDEYEKEFRENYYDLFDDLIPPLFDTDDKLLRILLINRIDVKKRKERNLLKEFVKTANAIEDERELIAIAKRQHKGLAEELLKRREISNKVRRAVKPPPKMLRHARNIVIPKLKKNSTVESSV